MKKELTQIVHELTKMNTKMEAIRVDLNHHIKRSDAHEIELSQFRVFRERLMGALQFLAFLATLATIYTIL